MVFIPRMQGWFTIKKKSNVGHHTNLLKTNKQKTAIISTNEQWKKLQHLLLTQTLHKLGIKKNFLNLVNSIYKRLLTNIQRKMWESSFPQEQEQGKTVSSYHFYLMLF